MRVRRLAALLALAVVAVAAVAALRLVMRERGEARSGEAARSPAAPVPAGAAPDAVLLESEGPSVEAADLAGAARERTAAPVPADSAALELAFVDAADAPVEGVRPARVVLELEAP
jgi:hypothetical protein